MRSVHFYYNIQENFPGHNAKQTLFSFIQIHCFTYAALRRFPAVAVKQTLAKAEKQKVQSDELENTIK